MCRIRSGSRVPGTIRLTMGEESRVIARTLYRHGRGLGAGTRAGESHPLDRSQCQRHATGGAYAPSPSVGGALSPYTILELGARLGVVPTRPRTGLESRQSGSNSRGWFRLKSIESWSPERRHRSGATPAANMSR